VANETFELYSLTSKLTLDTSQFDRAYGEAQKKIRAAPGDLKKLESATKGAGSSISKDLGGALAQIAPQLTVLTTAGAVGLVVAGMGLLSAAVTSAASEIWSLANTAADAGGEVFDLTQKVNFSAETISGLGQAGKRAGVDFQSFNASLGIFDKTMEKAKDGTKETVAVFKELGITSRDNETALRQAFTGLNDLGSSGRQTALAMQLFGKSGRDVLAVIKETNGDIDTAIEHYRRLGTVISTEDAAAADAFGDSLTQLREQLKGVERQLGQNTLPTFTAFFDEISKQIEGDQDRWYSWSNTINTVTTIALGSFLGLERGIRAAFARIEMGRWAELMKLPFQLGKYSFEETKTLQQRAQMMSESGGVTGQADKVLRGLRSSGGGYSPKGGGGGGGGKTERDPLDSLRASLVSLNAEYRKYNAELLGSANATSLAAEKEKILAHLMTSLKSEVKEKISGMRDVDEAINASISALPKKSQEAARALVEQAEAQAKLNLERKNAVDVDKRASDLSQGWRQEMDRARGGVDQYAAAIQDLEKEFAKYGATLDSGTRAELQQLAVMRRELEMVLSLTRAREVLRTTRERAVTREGKERPPWIDLGGGSTVGGEPGTTERPRVATVEEQVRRERAAILREQMDQLASDLTFTIDDAITEGFRKGVKAGVIEFGLGILEMARHEALQALERAISKALGGSGGQGQGSSGGGLWSTIFNFGMKAVGALIGGGSGSSGGLGSALGSSIGGHAGGGYMPPDSWSWVGERGPELVKAGPRGASVMPSGESTAFAGSHMTMNVYTNDAQSFASRRTQTQIKRGLRKMQEAA